MEAHDWNQDRQLERLVDGELCPEEYRELLQAMEREPDGWRRTALAFLEAQALGQDFAALRRAADAPQAVETAPLRQSAHEPSVMRLVLAMAASLLLAFGLGAWWRSTAVSSDASPAFPVAKEDHSSGAGTEVARPIFPGQDAPRRSVPLEQLTFVVDRGDGQSERFNMPIYDKDDAYARWLVEQPALPVEVERDLREAGFRIERRREWAPVQLEDGRRAVFPVDELQIIPAFNRTY